MTKYVTKKSKYVTFSRLKTLKLRVPLLGHFDGHFFGQPGENETFHKKFEANGIELELLNWNYPKLFNHLKHIAHK